MAKSYKRTTWSAKRIRLRIHANVRYVLFNYFPNFHTEPYPMLPPFWAVP